MINYIKKNWLDFVIYILVFGILDYAGAGMWAILIMPYGLFTYARGLKDGVEIIREINNG